MSGASSGPVVISPVSMEPLATLFPILHARASEVTLLTTVGSETALGRIKRALAGRGVVVTELGPVHATDATAIVDAVRRALADLPDRKAVVNLTPGTKVMSVVLALETVGRNCELIYADTGDDRIWTYGNGAWSEVPLAVPGLDVGFFVALAGCAARPGTARESWPELALFVGANAPAIDGLLDPMRGPGLERRVVLRRPWTDLWEQFLSRAKGHGLVREWTRRQEELVVLFRDNNAADYLARGYWLEDYVHSVALNCGFDEVQRNVEILRQDGTVLTDLDVAFISRHRLFVVSCKSGHSLGHRRPFDELVEVVGGLLAGAVVVSTKHAGGGVAEKDSSSSRGVRVESALLHDLPGLGARLTAMSTQVVRRQRPQLG